MLSVRISQRIFLLFARDEIFNSHINHIWTDETHHVVAEAWNLNRFLDGILGDSFIKQVILPNRWNHVFCALEKDTREYFNIIFKRGWIGKARPYARSPDMIWISVGSLEEVGLSVNKTKYINKSTAEQEFGLLSNMLLLFLTVFLVNAHSKKKLVSK